MRASWPHGELASSVVRPTRLGLSVTVCGSLWLPPRGISAPNGCHAHRISLSRVPCSLACHTTEARSLMEAPAAVVTVGDVFNVVDIGGSGGITAEEVIRFTAALGIRLTDEQVAAFMAADKDGDLQVDADVRLVASLLLRASRPCSAAQCLVSDLDCDDRSLTRLLACSLARQEWLASLNAAVEGSLVSWSDSFSSLPMDVLIGGPLKYD